MAKKYMGAREYCDETGFKYSIMSKLLHCYLAPEFSFRSGCGKTSPYYVITNQFEKMLERGDFREVLES